MTACGITMRSNLNLLTAETLTMAQQQTMPDPFADLTWDALEEWAGATIVSRGRSYQRSHQVQGLVRTASYGLVAWVHGTERYATSVEVEDGEIAALCTCPYEGTCKHAVAVVLEYLDCLKHKREVPLIAGRDRRLSLLEALENESEGWDDGEEGDEDDGDQAASRPPQRRSEKATADEMTAFLKQQSKEQLVTLLEEQARRNPNIRRALLDRKNLSSGSAKKLVNAIRADIDELDSEPDWEDAWDDGMGFPSCSQICERLEALLAAGHPDEILELGEELLEAAKRRVEMSNDEGELGEEVASCLDVVFRALPQSSLSPAEQILWAIDLELDDEYDLCRGAQLFWQQEQTPADWNIVADTLLSRLNQYKVKKQDDGFFYGFHRDRLSDWLITALERAGRHNEIIPLCEREAKITGSYIRLVDHLKAAERWEEVERWILTGIAATKKQMPGIASQLRTTLRELREREKNWLQVAAFYAEDFFHAPELRTFQGLQRAAGQAGVWPAVRAAAMLYMEAGVFPSVGSQAKKEKGASSWPLPETGVPFVDVPEKISAPMIVPLVEIAIAEKRPDDVLHWYDQDKPRAVEWEYSGLNEDKIADAVAEAYPDRALVLWKSLAERKIAETQTRAYETAATYLRKVHRLLTKNKREKEWQEYLTALRQTYRRKRSLMEILNHIEDRRIIGR